MTGIRQPFSIALRFLSRWPLRCGSSSLLYPLAGLLIGLVLLLVSFLLSGGDLLSAALLLAAWVLLSGTRPLSGLAACADAWTGGGDRERSLAILAGAHPGAAGVVAIVLVLGLKWTALTGLIAEGRWLPLLIAPVLGRLAALALAYATPPAPGTTPPAEPLPRREAARVLLLVMALIALAGGTTTLWVLLLAFLAFALLRAMMISRLGGATESGAGALVEFIEAVALVAYAMARGQV